MKTVATNTEDIYFTKCCCFFQLNKGAILLGWFDIVFGFSLLYYLMSIYKSIGYDEYDYSTTIDMEHYKLYVGITVIFVFVFILSTVLLLNGARDINPYLLAPWMFLQIIGIFFALFIVVIYLNNSKIVFSDEYNIAKFGAALVFIYLRIYWFMCIKSYYTILKQHHYKLINVDTIEKLQDQKSNTIFTITK